MSKVYVWIDCLPFTANHDKSGLLGSLKRWKAMDIFFEISTLLKTGLKKAILYAHLLSDPSGYPNGKFLGEHNMFFGGCPKSIRKD